jgi:hypothetical protein
LEDTRIVKVWNVFLPRARVIPDCASFGFVTAWHRARRRRRCRPLVLGWQAARSCQRIHSQLSNAQSVYLINPEASYITHFGWTKGFERFLDWSEYARLIIRRSRSSVL